MFRIVPEAVSALKRWCRFILTGAGKGSGYKALSAALMALLVASTLGVLFESSTSAGEASYPTFTVQGVQGSVPFGTWGIWAMAVNPNTNILYV